MGENDRATLVNIQNKNLDLSDEKLSHISEQGRDFLRKTLNFDPHARLDVASALNHPWLNPETYSGGRTPLNIMDNLRDYKYKSDKWVRII